MTNPTSSDSRAAPPSKRWTPFILGGLVLLLIAAGAIAFWHREGGTGPSDDRPVLRVGSQKGGAKSVLIASGVLKDLPYRIEWSEFPAAQNLLEALSAGAIDVGTVGDAPFLFAYEAGGTIVAVQASRTAEVAGTSGILVPRASTIRSAADLKGKRIATGRGSAGHYLLLKALTSAGLKASDVTIVFLSPSDSNAALQSGAVDAWSTWPPYVGAALLHGGDRIAVDAKGLVSGHLLQAASTAAVHDKPELLRDFLKRYASALAWSNSHPDKAAEILTSETGLPIDVARYSVDRQKWIPVAMDKGFFEYQRDVLQLFSTAGNFAVARPVEQAFDPRLFTPQARPASDTPSR